PLVQRGERARDGREREDAPEVAGLDELDVFVRPVGRPEEPGMTARTGDRITDPRPHGGIVAQPLVRNLPARTAERPSHLDVLHGTCGIAVHSFVVKGLTVRPAAPGPRRGRRPRP